MRVGVIVPVHGWAPYLAEALDSVLAEGPHEVVVVDDGSPDPVPVAHPVTVVRRSSRGGPAAARQAGLEALPECELIALCDADDAWRPGRLRAQLAALGSADVAVGRAVVVGPDGRPTGERWEAIPAGPFVPPYDRNPVCTSSVLIRRAALERTPFLSEALLERAEDHDLWLRLASNGARFVSVPEAVVAYRRRAGALTADVAALARAEMEVHARHAERADEEERRRVEEADRRALVAGLVRERRWGDARSALRDVRAHRSPDADRRALLADAARAALLAVPVARGAMGRRAPYRRR
jgi:glycosyltransferase involved in cell wall biosynthesis